MKPPPGLTPEFKEEVLRRLKDHKGFWASLTPEQQEILLSINEEEIVLCGEPVK